MGELETRVCYTMDEILERQIGPIGTPARDEFEADISREIRRIKVAYILQQIKRNVAKRRYGKRKKIVCSIRRLAV